MNFFDFLFYVFVCISVVTLLALGFFSLIETQFREKWSWIIFCIAILGIVGLVYLGIEKVF